MSNRLIDARSRIVARGNDGIRISPPVRTPGARRVKDFEKTDGDTTVTALFYVPHGLTDGQTGVKFRADGWHGDTLKRHPANGTWTVTVLDAYTCVLQGSAWGTLDPVYISGSGVMWPGSQIDIQATWKTLVSWLFSTGGGELILPTGMLAVLTGDTATSSNTGLWLPAGVHVRGQDKELSMLFSGDFLNKYLLQTLVGASNWSFRDLFLHGNRGYQGTGGYHLYRGGSTAEGDTTDFVIERVMARAAGGYGFALQGDHAFKRGRLNDIDISGGDSDLIDVKGRTSQNTDLILSNWICGHCAMFRRGIETDLPIVRSPGDAAVDLRGEWQVSNVKLRGDLTEGVSGMRLRTGAIEGGVETFNGEGAHRSQVSNVYIENTGGMATTSVGVSVACSDSVIHGITVKNCTYGVRPEAASRRNVIGGIILIGCPFGLEDRGEDNIINGAVATLGGTDFRAHGYQDNNTGSLDPDPFYTEIGSDIVVITHIGHGRAAGEPVTFYESDGSGPLDANGISMRANFVILDVPDADHYTVNSDADVATATGNAGGTGVKYLYKTLNHVTRRSNWLNCVSHGASVLSFDITSSSEDMYLSGCRSLGTDDYPSPTYTNNGSGTIWGPGNVGLPSNSRGITLLPSTPTTTQVTAADNGKRFLTQNATGLNIVELALNPDTNRDWEIELYSRDNDGLRILCQAGYILEFGSIGVTSSGGYIETSGTAAVKARSAVKIRAIRNNAFMVVSHEGDWTVA